MTSFDYFDLYPEARDEAPEAPAPLLPAIVTVKTPEKMPEEFARSTMLALATQQEILSMPMPDEDDPNYKAKLAAKASVAAQQISAQQRSDESALKFRAVQISIADEIKAAIRDYKTKYIEN